MLKQKRATVPLGFHVDVFSHLVCIEIQVKSDLHDRHLLVELDVDEVGLSAVCETETSRALRSGL